MKISFVLLFGFCLQTAAKGYSQGDVKITLELNGVKLSKALNVIEEKSGYRILYSNDDLPAFRKVNINVRDELLPAVLDKLLAEANLKYKLNGVVPYILCTGNHDYGVKSAENRYSQFNSYFPPQFNPLTKSILVEMAPNAEGVATLENACYKWTSPLGQPFLIFALEFAPRKAMLEWAKQVAARPQYRNHTGVMITHSYLNSNGERIVRERYRVKDANYGEAMWQQLVQPASNIRFVFSGHIGNSNEHIDQVGYRQDTNADHQTVHQVVFNAQREGGGWHGNGGDGWLRILEFLPDRKTLKVSTFSPFFYISPSTRHLSWRKEAYDEFILTY